LEDVVLATGVALEEGAVLEGIGASRIRDTSFWEDLLASQ
jgi:hypothetical protein